MAVVVIIIGFVLFIIILLLVTLFITLSRQNKGSIDYGDNSLNILENKTTTDNKDN